jgi:versiconal hemiacetal acetate esterase
VALVPLTLHWDNVPSKYTSIYTSYTENEKDVPVNDKECLDIMYCHVGFDPKDPDVFTALAEDHHKDLPPAYFVNCEYDPMRDDTTVMVKALREAGVPVKHDYYEGLPHIFWAFPRLPETKGFEEKLVEGVRWVLEQN